MAGDLQPLYNNLPIVNADGKPTDYFIRWAQQRQIDITESITLEILEEYTRYFRALSERAGASATGADSVAVGPETVASGVNATAVSRGAIASGNNTAAFGFNAEATGNSSTAVGGGAVAAGSNSFAGGRLAEANAGSASSVGFTAVASGQRSGAFGANALADANDATAVGSAADAGFVGSTAVGYQATTSAANEVALGGTGNSVRIGDISASTAAQSGSTSPVSVDANGVLGVGTGAAFSGAKVYSTAAITPAVGATTILSTWDTEDYDTGGWWSAGTADSFVIPAGVTKVNINFNMSRVASITGQFIARISLYSAANALLGDLGGNEIDTTGGDSASVTVIGANVTAGMRVKARYFVATGGDFDNGLYGTTFSIQATG